VVTLCGVTLYLSNGVLPCSGTACTAWLLWVHMEELLSTVRVLLPQVSEKVLAIAEENQALKLVAGEATSKAETFTQERAMLLTAQEELHSEVCG
jgi:hypothetical protein